MSAPAEAAAPPSAAPGAHEALSQVTARVEVWPGCVHPLTRAEAALTATAPFQRLRRLRQMGLAFHAWPNAENTRASHSLGVAYWAGAYLAALESAGDAETQRVLARAKARLGGLSLDVVVRLFALIHDIDLLPLGHTLRYQSGAFAEAAGRPRLKACVAAIKAGVRDGAFLDAPSLAAFDAHLDAAAAALSAEDDGLVHALVNSGLGADLMDFALRDSAAITREQARHDAQLQHLRLLGPAQSPRLALDITDPATAAERVAAAADLYRARWEIFAASVYHPTKLAADAMLDFVVRRLGAARCAPDRLLSMGDDELLDHLVAAEAEAGLDNPVALWLRRGQLHQEVWRTEDLVRFQGRADAEDALALAPAWRTVAEARLLDRLPWAAAGEVIVAISPPRMQAKPADAQLLGPDGPFTLAEAAAHGFDVDAHEVAQRYRGLWSLRVYLAVRRADRAKAVAAAAAELFEGAA